VIGFYPDIFRLVTEIVPRSARILSLTESIHNTRSFIRPSPPALTPLTQQGSRIDHGMSLAENQPLDQLRYRLAAQLDLKILAKRYRMIR